MNIYLPKTISVFSKKTTTLARNKSSMTVAILLASTFLSPAAVSAADFSFNDYNNHFYVGESEVYDTVSGTASDISGDYYGSAIQNKGNIKDLSASFEKNSTTGQGGAVFNDGYNNDKSIIDKITGNFTGNSSGQEGGAIYNSGTIGDIIGSHFKNNQATLSNPDFYAQGGAIFNSGANGGGIINDIVDAQFIGNTTTGVGGAISNRDGAKINDISGIFEKNSASQGSVLYNFGASVNSIGGTFESNGGSEVIFNLVDNNSNAGHIGTISGTFINNTASSVIYNMSSNIDTISADFTNNTVSGSDAVIKNLNSTIGQISGDKTYSGNKGGVVIMNLGSNGGNSTIGDIAANFVNNNINGQNGVIYNLNSKIGNITGTFSENIRASNGGAIWNYNSSIRDITGKFDKNNSSGNGGAIDNEQGASILDIYADFSENSSNNGGAIANNNGSSIDNIIGNFTDNNSQNSQGGAIWNNGSSIKDIVASFINNISGEGGAIFNNNSSIDNIEGMFSGNQAKNNQGGAIFNNNASIKDINGGFTDNSAASHGGAIWNNNSIGNIEASFSNNSAGITSGYGDGGAIWNNGSAAQIGDITGSFINNSANQSGGAIWNNDAKVGNVIGNFASNQAKSDGGAIWNNRSEIGDIAGSFEQNSSGKDGGAIWNNGTGKDSIVGNILGDFRNNTAKNNGGAIWNIKQALIGNIDGNFVGNSAETNGGAIWNVVGGKIGNINGSFVNNTAILGGAIHNALSEDPTMLTGTDSHIGNITGDFISNSADFGGAIWNSSKLGTISGTFSNNTAKENGAGIYNIGNNPLTFVNSSFINNTAQNLSGEQEIGSAIYSEGNLILEVNNGYTSLISGNKAGNNGNDAIYIKNANLTLNANSNATMIFDDHVNGNNYNVDIYGDGTGVVKFNGLVKNVNDINLHANSIVHLGIDAQIFAKNYYADESASVVSHLMPGTMAITQASGIVPLMTVDVYVDRATNAIHSGTITVDGDVIGTTHVLVNALNPDILDNYEDAITPFLYAPDDSETTSAAFVVSRVNGSPYLWYAQPNVKDTPEKGNIWYLALSDQLNPNFDRYQVAPEVISYIGLHSAAIEQTRNLSRIVRDQAAAGKTYCAGINCGIYEDAWNGKPLSNVWAYVDYSTSTIDKPVSIDADVWGVTGGFDIQSNINHKLGIFAAYRQGDYDLSGKGVRHHATSGSKIDLDSYTGGLYYRYDKNNWWGFATLFGGVQKADLKTDDGIVKTDTDGTQFGASAEAGKLFALTDSLTLEPSMGVFYTQVDFDNIRDNAGKIARYETIQYWELEAGVKLEKSFGLDEGTAKVYFKPSVIQTLSNNDKVNITGLYPISTYHDQTLGRMELGGKASLGWSWSLYGWINYTFGSSYDATAFGAGLNYAF